MAKRSKKHKRTFAPLLSLLAITNIVGVGFASFLLNNDEVFVGEIGDVSIGVGGFNDNVVEITSFTGFQYGEGGFKGSADYSPVNTGSISFTALVNLVEYKANFGQSIDTLQLKIELTTSGYDLISDSNISFRTNAATISVGSANGYGEINSSDDSCYSCFYGVKSLSSVLNTELSISSTIQITYSGSDFYNDIYTKINNNFTLKIKAIVEGESGV